MDDFEELEQTVESVDNNLRKSNIRLKGVKGGVEGKDLKQFLEEVFTACLGSDCDVVVQIDSAFYVGNINWTLLSPRAIVVKLPTWLLKSKLLEVFWEQAGLEIAGTKVSVFADLSLITLKNKKSLHFLTAF